MRRSLLIAFATLGISGCNFFPYLGGSSVNPLSLISLAVASELGGSGLDTSSLASVTEGIATPTQYTVVLENQPSVDVQVQATPDAQVLIDGASTPKLLTFTPENWDIVQTISVTAVDDQVSEGNHVGLITNLIIAGDPDYVGRVLPTVAVSIVDNDSAGVSVVGSPIALTENNPGIQGSYTVALTSQPTATVTVTANANAQQQVNGGASAALNFTTVNWMTPQTITVTQVNDNVAEGAHVGSITHTVTSADAGYNGLAAAGVTVNLADDDTAGVSVSKASINISEDAGQDTYTVALTSEPTTGVTVSIPFDTTQVTLNGSGTSPLTLAFNSGNWSNTQTVTVQTVGDALDEPQPHQVTLQHNASGATEYGGVTGSNLTVNITDNDTAGVNVSAASVNVSEATPGTPANYDLVLTSQPTAAVTISLTFDATQVTVNGSSSSPQTVVFSTGNWSTPQSVSIRAVDDLIDETSTHIATITQAATSGDANYNGVSVNNVSANISDNDTRGVTVSKSSISLSETGPTSDNYTMMLNTQPTATVTLSINFDGTQVLVNGSSSSPRTLTFTTGNYASPQMVTVQAINDDYDETSPHNITITHSASGGDYTGTSINSVTTGITDNDTADYVLSATSGTTTDGGLTASFTLRLASRPTADVTIGLSSSNTAQGTVSPASLTFTNSNWSVTQTFIVTGVNDNTFNSGSVGYTIVTAPGVSADGSYNGLNPADISMSNIHRNYRTYRTTTGYSGNLGGISGADAKCEAEKPASLSGKTVKAFLSDGQNRRACTSFDCNGGIGENLDWVLQPNANYWRIDETTRIGNTDNEAIFHYIGVSQTVPDLINGFSSGGSTYYHTGIRYDWTFDDSFDCSNWTSTSNDMWCGNKGETEYFAYGWVTCSCASSLNLFCVEQP